MLKITNYIARKNLRVLVILSLAVGCFMSLHSILNGYSAFWYDPARDFMLALDNLKNMTLLGSPTGIPGIFYGPYWIWLISFGLIFSKDPAIIIILLMLIPYFVIFPLILFKFSKIFSTKTCLALWWLFFFSSGKYFNQLWNVNYAPLVFLSVIYLITTLFSQTQSRLRMVKLFALSALCAFLVNFHFSFGFSISLATTIFVTFAELFYLISINQALLKKTFKFAGDMAVLFLGFLAVETPFLIFETRHQFIQIKAILNTVIQSVLYSTAVVGQTGLKKPEIIKNLTLVIPSQILEISIMYLGIIYILIILTLIYYLIAKKIAFSKVEKSLIIFLFLSQFTTLGVYLSSRNPIYDYHFYGLEMSVLLLIALAVEKIGYLKSVLYFWVFLFVVTNMITYYSNYTKIQYEGTPLWLKKTITKTVYDDAKNNPFSVSVYSPAIYTYDYDYLFLWLGKQYKNLPKKNTSSTNVVYLIIPQTSRPVYYDFINYKTPNSLYKTQNIWVTIDGTTILKRQTKTD